MKPRNAVYWTLLAVAALSSVAGVLAMVLPGVVLYVMGAPESATHTHFFQLIGMFIFLFGGVFFHALRSPRHHPTVLLWVILEKIGATTMVTLGVFYAFFAPLALALAGYDLLSGALAFAYWRSIRTTP